MLKVKTAVKIIGGYCDLQLAAGTEYYPTLIKLNTGRNALEYILIQKNYTKVYLPYFTCDVLLEPIIKLGIDYSFYKINESLEPIIDFVIEKNACLLYTNYFGIKQEAVKRLSNEVEQLVVDNSQAFFSPPIVGIDTFYSCRKFFGVSDGSYLQIRKKLAKKFKVDSSLNRISHLIKSIELGIEAGYSDYKANNEVLKNNEIKSMSLLTQRILSSIDYKNCAHIRTRNFNFLHKHLKPKNLLQFIESDEDSPMIYPFLSENKDLKLHLIQHKIFVATYWPNVFDWTTRNMFENYLARNIIALPIDHRYTLKDMLYIIQILRQIS